MLNAGRPAVTETFKKDLAEAADNGTRERLLYKIVEGLKPSFELFIGEGKLTTKQIEDAVQKFAGEAQNLNADGFTKSC